MLSTLDKILILKSVSPFSQLSDELLQELADLLQDVQAPAGHTIFEKGDMGNAMYIIVEGKVRVHIGERTLNHLGRRDFFGEMAALDPEPRSASVTAVEDSQLLRLDQHHLYGVMSTHIEVVEGIIHALVQHLRARMRDMYDDYQYMQQFNKVTAAAAAVEAGVYDPESLDEVTKRTDALGQLARLFQRMVREVQAREQRLQQQVQELRVEIDEVRKQREVEQITQSELFQSLREKAKELRKRSSE